MKKINILYSAITAAFMLSSCSDFLDTMPDNRAEIDTEAKITSLLVSAYPTAYPIMMAEMASDNAMDNGSLYSVESQSQEDAYLWQDIVTDTDGDAPQGIWDACYMAIASANHALQAIEQMGNPSSLSAQRGEALICRAYGHFVLATTFCEAYNYETAGNKLGIPYSITPEAEVAPHYVRGTLAETYSKIAADIEEGLPLINDNLYSVPKYHFNRKAAHAFAARFYLYYLQADKSNYEKVIEYASVVLGTVPSKVLRTYDADFGTLSNPTNVGDAFIAAKSPANLLITPINSSWPYIYGPYSMSQRYGQAKEICDNENLRADGIWGTAANLVAANTIRNPQEKMPFPKLAMYFEYTDKVNGIGYRHAVIVPFTTNETLLCRAEAYIMKAQPEYGKAVSDINDWLTSVCYVGKAPVVTEDDINTFYKNIEYTPIPIESAAQRTVKKELNPIIQFVDEKQENLIHCILHLRRIETIHEGLRWYDIKRYGIEISHNREGLSPDILTKNDLRRAFQLPQDVINAGLDANPRN